MTHESPNKLNRAKLKRTGSSSVTVSVVNWSPIISWQCFGSTGRQRRRRCVGDNEFFLTGDVISAGILYCFDAAKIYRRFDPADPTTPLPPTAEPDALASASSSQLVGVLLSPRRNRRENRSKPCQRIDLRFSFVTAGAFGAGCDCCAAASNSFVLLSAEKGAFIITYPQPFSARVDPRCLKRNAQVGWLCPFFSSSSAASSSSVNEGCVLLVDRKKRGQQSYFNKWRI